MRSRFLLTLLLQTALLLGGACAAHAARPTPCSGRYGLDVSLVTGQPAAEFIEVSPGQVVTGSCGPTRARVKGGRRATKVKATFRSCSGVVGKAKLVAKIGAPECTVMTGRFTARRSRIKTPFTASGGGILAGAVRVPAGALADADTADGAQQGDNDTPETAQALPLVATVGGAAGVGDGSVTITGGDNSWTASDFYRLELDGHPLTIRLNIGDPAAADLDLFLFDPEGNTIVDPSAGTANVEQIDTTASGTAFLVVAAYQGGPAGVANYVLGVGQTAGGLAATTLPDMVDGEIIVRFRDDTPSVAMGRLALSDTEATWVSGDPTRPSGALFRLPAIGRAAAEPRAATVAAAEALAKRPDVLWAQPNYLRRAQLVPNDEYYGLQWHYPAISLPAAWDVTTGNPGVIVAVIDTGLLTNHPDIDGGRLVAGYDFIADPGRARDGDGIDPDPFDVGDRGAGGASSFHGTHVAGTIGAATNDGDGVAGIDWVGRIMPIRVLGANGGSDFDIAQGIRFAAGIANDSGTVPAQRADIINMSLGGPGTSPAMREAVQAARAAGTIVIVAAGNDNEDANGFVPASFPEVVCVSSVDLASTKAPYSNFGTAVDVAAPGGDTSVDRDGNGYVDGVLSPLADDSGGGLTFIYKFYQGTSMASPHVAGVAALMQAAFMSANGGARMSPDTFDALLASGAITDPIGDANLYGFGLVNAQKAVAAAGGGAGSGAPSVLAVPASVSFSPDRQSASLLIRNGGSGGLTVNAIAAGGDAPWLAVQVGTLPAPAPVSVTLVPNRAGLTPGTYTGSVIVDTSAGSATVPVALEVTATGNAGSGDVGPIYVLLVDPSTFNTVAAAQSTAGSGYPIDFGGLVPGGNYLLVAGTDRNGDQFIDDAGEALGVYPTIDSPQLVTIPWGGQVTGLELPVLEQVAIVAGSTSTDGGERLRLPRFRRLP